MKADLIKIIAPVLALSMSAILGGCATEAEFYPIEGARIENAVPAARVEMFITKRPDFLYSELGLITYSASANSSPQSELQAYEIMRAKAGEIGARGLIILNSQNAVYSFPNYNFDLSGNLVENNILMSNTTYRGMAISPKENADKQSSQNEIGKAQ